MEMCIRDRQWIDIATAEPTTVGGVRLQQRSGKNLSLIHISKPAAVKGQYLKSVTLTSTMGPGVKINPAKLV